MKKSAPSRHIDNHQVVTRRFASFVAVLAIPARQRGAGTVEYMAITGAMVAALLTPFSLGEEPQSTSVLQRLMNALHNQQAAYNYSAQVPVMPSLDEDGNLLGDISLGGGDEGNGSGNPGDNDSTSGGAGGANGDPGDEGGQGSDEGGDDSQDGDSDSGDGDATEEDGANDDGSGNADGNPGDGMGGGSGGDLPWEAAAALGAAVCVATPEQNPFWTQDDLTAYQAAQDAYSSNFEESKNSFEEHGIPYPIEIEGEADGFSATLSKTDSGQWVLAFRGTDGVNQEDWSNNAKQALMGSSSQYDNALELADRVKRVLGEDVLIAGHSLGGGLAAAAAYETGLDAVTFNAAGLHDNYRHDEQGNKKTPGAIRNHYIVGELLTTLQVASPVPEAAGEQIAHSASCLTDSFSRHSISKFEPPGEPGKEHPDDDTVPEAA
ncbi:Mbeg1-like protein [Halomonas sp. CUBES01]|uniref:Mbeg1-like protein n=1 Tax=Halomonas sp. CUBES01 TaxID=2897340 RepID=UPI001E316E09|nr:Mbeg1-like protein [Halomonas sp. CUBES01]MEC4766136.1 Mbeg1-like protein [Halomonas sp. CUBES01]